jgi:hypothetical protein
LVDVASHAQALAKFGSFAVALLVDWWREEIGDW